MQNKCDWVLESRSNNLKAVYKEIRDGGENAQQILHKHFKYFKPMWEYYKI